MHSQFKNCVSLIAQVSAMPSATKNCWTYRIIRVCDLFGALECRKFKICTQNKSQASALYVGVTYRYMGNPTALEQIRSAHFFVCLYVYRFLPSHYACVSKIVSCANRQSDREFFVLPTRETGKLVKLKCLFGKRRLGRVASLTGTH